MSREFGGYRDGYFHDQMQYAAEDCADGREALTRAWAHFFEAFTPIAYAIASSEASDASAGRAIMANLTHWGAVRDAIAGIEEFLEPYRELCEEVLEGRPAADAKARATLRECAIQFRFYEGEHLRKRTPEGYEKAARNAEFAAKCEAVLAQDEGGQANG